MENLPTGYNGLNILLHATIVNVAEGQLGWKKRITNLPLCRVAFIDSGEKRWQCPSTEMMTFIKSAIEKVLVLLLLSSLVRDSIGLVQRKPPIIMEAVINFISCSSCAHRFVLVTPLLHLLSRDEDVLLSILGVLPTSEHWLLVLNSSALRVSLTDAVTKSVFAPGNPSCIIILQPPVVGNTMDGDAVPHDHVMNLCLFCVRRKRAGPGLRLKTFVVNCDTFKLTKSDGPPPPDQDVKRRRNGEVGRSLSLSSTNKRQCWSSRRILNGILTASFVRQLK